MRRERILDVLPGLLAAYLVFQLAVAWAGRFSYPYDLEWMEGGMLVHAWRAANGLTLYPAPGPEFIPFVYPPGYSYVLALLGYVVGLSHSLGRAVSIAGTLAAGAAISFAISRHYGERLVGVLAAVVFLGCYQSSGAFYDLVRPDAACMGLVAWAIVLGLERHRRLLDAAALLLCCAYFFKQNSAAFGFPMALAIWARDDWKSALRFGLVAAVPALLGTIVMQLSTGGHFLGYLVAVPSAHPSVLARGYAGVPREAAGILPFALVVVAVWSLASVRRWAPVIPNGPHVAVPVVIGGSAAMMGVNIDQVKGIPVAASLTSVIAFGSIGVCIAVGLMVLIGSVMRRQLAWKFVYGFGIAAVALAVAGLMRAHHGGFVNVLMGLHWAIALGLGASIASVRRDNPGLFLSALTALMMAGQLLWQVTWMDAAARKQFAADLEREDGGLVAAIVNFRPGYSGLIPSQADRDAGDKLVEALRTYEGPVLSPYAPWIAVQAGFAPGLHLIALWDVAQHKQGPYFEQAKSFSAAARQHHWATVVDGTKPMRYGVSGENGAYRVDQIVVPQGKIFAPKTGWRARPHAILVPKQRPN